MKKLALAAAICISTLNAQAQYADIGVHGGFGTTWFINNNVSDQGANLDPQFSLGPVMGIHMAYSINKTLGIKTEINYAIVNQKYKGEETAPKYEWEGKDRGHYLELPVLLLLQSNAFYCEIGPKFNFLTVARSEFKITSSGFGTGMDYENANVTTSYRNAFVSAVLGLGGNFKLSKGWYMNAGLRFCWGLGDQTRDFSKSGGNGPSDMGIGSVYAHQDQKGNLSYEKTHLATGHIMIGFSRRFPY